MGSDSKSVSRESMFVKIIILLISIYVFFEYLLPGKMEYIVLIGTIGVFIIYYLVNVKIQITNSQILIIFLLTLFMLIQLLPSGYSVSPSSGMKTALNRSAVLILGIMFCVFYNWYDTKMKYFYNFSSIHIYMTLFAFFLPFIFKLIIPLFPSEVTSYISVSMSKGFYPGITDQIARNAFYITIGISLVFTKLRLIKTKCSSLKYISIGFFLLAMLLTGKRGHLVANVLSMLFIIAIFALINRKGFFRKTFRIIFILVSVLLLLIYIFPESSMPIIRFIEKMDGDQTSGRIPLYISAINLFKEKPILGWGTGSFHSLNGLGNHNIYLQLLSENGIIGFITFILIILMNYYKTIKSIKFNTFMHNTTNLKYLSYSLYIQIFFIFYGLTGNPINDTYIFMTYLVASSLSYTIDKSETNSYRKVSEY